MDMRDIKQGMPNFQRYARSHTNEFFSILALVIASFSCWKGLVFGTVGWSLLAFNITAIWAIVAPNQANSILEQYYKLTTRQSKTAEVIVGAIKLAVALVIPWATFAIVGMLAGESYHNYSSSHRNNRNHYNKAA